MPEPYIDVHRRRRAQRLAAKLVEDTLSRNLAAFLEAPAEERGHDLDGLIVLAELVAALRHPDGDLDQVVADTLKRALEDPGLVF